MESREKLIKKEMGKRLRFLRSVEGSTQEDIASVLGCTPDHISRVENGERGLSYDCLLKASTYYLVSVDWILTGRNSSNSFSKQLNKLAADLRNLANGVMNENDEEMAAE